MQKVEVEHHIPARVYTTIKYIAYDGCEFDTESACLRHERDLEIEKHPVFKSKTVGAYTLDDWLSADLYYISSREDFEFFKKSMGYRSYDSDFDSHGAGWYMYWVIDGGDGPDYPQLRNLNAYEKELEEDLHNWKENIHRLIGKRKRHE